MKAGYLAFLAAMSLLSGCASHSPSPVSPAPYPLYRMEAPPSRVPTSAVPSVPSMNRPVPARGHTATWYPAGRRISPRWTTIVLHHSATVQGGARRFDKSHRESNGWDELGYHFVIGNGTDTPDGHVEVGSRWHKQKHGAHCKTPNNYYNDHGIGICLVGDFTKSSPTPRQLDSARDLVRFLSDACRIPASRVTTHGAVTRKTACPGRRFPLESIRTAAVGSGGGRVAVGH